MATLRLCSIPDCGKSARGLGLCPAHYTRQRRHGDPLGGRTSPGEPLDYFFGYALRYEGNDCLTWPYACYPDGRAEVRYRGRTRSVSRMICETVNGPAPTPRHEAAHSCGRGHFGCIAKSHLFWKTPIENHADKIVHGTTNRGMKSPLSKLSDDDVRAIRALKGYLTQQEIATLFDIGRANISAIHTGRSWGWL